MGAARYTCPLCGEELELPTSAALSSLRSVELDTGEFTPRYNVEIDDAPLRAHFAAHHYPFDA